MKLRSIATLVMPALAAAGAWASPTVKVDYVNPQDYTDAGYTSRVPTERERQGLQRDVTAIFDKLAGRYLADDESLHVEVLDIDLAGDIEPLWQRTGRDMRVVRDVTWPKMTLRYSLQRGSETVASGETRLSDMDFLQRTPRTFGDDRLKYEQAMLDQWFRDALAKR